MDASAVAFERATIESDGETLAARWYAGGDEDAALPVVVLSHPHTKFGGSSGMMDGLARELVVRGRLRVLCVDTRGAGRSSGAATWTGWDEVKDVRAACRATGTCCGSHASNSSAASSHATLRVSQVRFGGAGPGGSGTN